MATPDGMAPVRERAQAALSVPLLRPGKTCWRVERADHLRVVIDAADYFVAVKSAMLKARDNVMLIGWDFDTRIRFEAGPPTLSGPNRLDHFLQWLVKRQPGLHVRMLKWDVGILQSLRRGMMPLALVNLASSKRLHLKLDGTHPAGAAHHQKLVVVDDEMAFCGGIDMTMGRWDTRAHRDQEPRRRGPRNHLLEPWHDATLAVDGALARALGELARRRWQVTTGERLAPVEARRSLWPERLAPTLRDVSVGIARSQPQWGEREELREVEALYLASIAAARNTIYIESQYLASRELAEALAARLQEADGPEIVIILPRHSDTWLERESMDSARTRMLQLLHQADTNQRLGVFYPVTARGVPIYVHAKIMIIDDLLLRVGSSNLNNRSMGFDTECDLAIEASRGQAALRARIRAIRADLLGEHLGVDPATLGEGARADSLLASIRQLRTRGRSLRPFAQASLMSGDNPWAENAMVDPADDTLSAWLRLWRGLSRFVRRKKH